MATTQELLALEAKVRDARLKAAGTAAAKKAMKAVMDDLVGLMAKNQAVQSRLEQDDAQAQANLSALTDVSAIDNYGAKSIVDTFLFNERTAAKSAAVDYVKANPECTQFEAEVAWDQGGLASHPGLDVVCQPGASMSILYRGNLLAGGYITENTWEAHRAWIVATPKEIIMGA